MDTPVSLTHANPPTTIPTGKTLRGDCVGSSQLDKTLCGKPHTIPTQSIYHFWSSRNPHAIPTNLDVYL